MKFAMKSIVAAASFVAVAAAQAAIVTVPTDGVTVSNGVTVSAAGSLEFSQGLAGALSLGKAQVGAYGGGTATQVSRSVTKNGKTTTYKTYVIGAGVSSLSYDNANGNKVTEVVSTGGTTQTLADADANASIVADGGTASIGDLDVKFNADGSVNIYGKIVGQSYAATPANVNWSGLLFTVAAANVTGTTAFSTTAGTYNTTLSNLAITQDGFDQLAAVFGLAAGELGYNTLSGAASNFGTLSSPSP